MLMDITSLQNALNTNVTDSITSEVQDQFEKLLVWVLVPSIILTVIVIIMYIVHFIHRHKIDKAIIEIRDTVRELKLAQTTPANPWHKLETPAVSTPLQEDSTKVQ